MEDGRPLSLVEVCVTCVCCTLEDLCAVCDDGSLRLRFCPVLPPELSDLLLQTLSDQGLLNDRTIEIFQDAERLRLKRACVRSSRLCAASFCRSICSHRLLELDASRISGDIEISDVLRGLSSCGDALQRLNVSAVPGIVHPNFNALPGLRSLCVSWTLLDNSALEDICSLPLLESLDISGTEVTDLRPLRRLRARLRSLTIHALHRLSMSTRGLITVLSELKLLTHLDVSNDLMESDEGLLISALLQEPRILLEVKELDVSGWRGISDRDVKTFVERRPGMRFIGLLATGAGRSESLSGEGNLKVAGEQTLRQLSEALRRYRERQSFLQEALLNLYNLTNETDVRSGPELLKLVCLAMKTHPEGTDLQVTGAMCVLNLTSLDLEEQMPLSLMGNVVQHILNTMRNHPDHDEVQKVCLMILCNDHVLHHVPFNRYEAAQQLMRRLSCNKDELLQTMRVSVVFLLLSQMSFEEMKKLGSEEFVIKQLLCVVQQKASVGVCDSTLEFTLTCLWSLTDDTHSACTHFLHCDGLELYTELLETYSSVPSVLQKVLGLLNNVSEMEDLHESLMDEDLLQMVVTLMEITEVSVSYFAGGFLANVTSSTNWNQSTTIQNQYLTKLHSAVMSWTPPEDALVTYRSFGPLLSLLRPSRPPAVQLWALWAIKHVCTNNVSHYSRMLTDEGGLHTLHALTSDPDTHPDVHALALNTLRLVQG